MHAELYAQNEWGDMADERPTLERKASSAVF